MKKVCTASGKEFEVTEEDLKFYEKIGMPTPTLCPEERQRRRLTWRNERKLYWRKCDATGKKILSIYAPESPFTVYNAEYWYSDQWDPKNYGQDYDFNKPFFQQFRELMERVPLIARSVFANENCDFVNRASWNKDCYLIIDGGRNEKCFYSESIGNSQFCADASHLGKCELCYECEDCENCYDCRFVQNSVNCSESWFLKNCIGCSNCFGCINLHNKQYYYLNEKYTKEEYAKKISELGLENHSNLKDLRVYYMEFVEKYPHKYIHGTKNENSIGDHLNSTKNCQFCFDVSRSQDCKYLYDCTDAKDCYDVHSFGQEGGIERCYECHEIGNGVQNIYFGDSIVEGCHDLYYSKDCDHCHDVFGCISLRHAEYCIFNKQYTKEEYTQLVPKIIQHMQQTGEAGQFFPTEISPFAYNETAAQEYYPMTKEEVLAKGWRWRDEDDKNYQSQTYEIPDSIHEVEENICNEILACEDCGKNYKIQKSELAFYKKLSLPIPRKCANCRYLERKKLRNPRILHNRTCDKCGVDIQTTFAPDRPEKIYCEKCYLQEVN